MSDYHGKVLELVAIEKNNDKSYLLINLSFHQQVKLYWEIDSFTAQHLKEVTNFSETYRYRLSLHCKWDTINKHYRSFITKTYRHHSERFSFVCSVDFTNELEAISSVKTIHDLKDFPFLTMNPFVHEGKSIQDKQTIEQYQEGEVIQGGYIQSLKWVVVSMVIAISLILYGYYGPFNKVALKNTNVTNASVETSNLNVNSEMKVVSPATKLVEDNPITISSIPYLELDDFITYSIPEGYVALTFDDGPSKYTKEIVNILKQYEVGATFFFTGLNIKKHPKIVRYVQSNGYSIGGHSMSHQEMSSFSYEKQEEEILHSTKAIEDITEEEVVLFRPPYGATNDQMKDIIHDNKKKLILWNNDPEDWRTKNAHKIVNHVYNTEVSGSIILLHESQAVIDALPQIIKHLQEQELKIVGLR